MKIPPVNLYFFSLFKNRHTSLYMVKYELKNFSSITRYWEALKFAIRPNVNVQAYADDKYFCKIIILEFIQNMRFLFQRVEIKNDFCWLQRL